MLLDGIGVLASLLILTIAGDQFVIALARLAARFGIRPTVIATIVGGLGTSVPQLLVSGLAARRGEPQIAIGSLVGSIIAAACLALALAALLVPIEVDSKAIRREVPLSVAAVLSFGLLALGGLSHFEAKILMVLALPAIGILVVSARPAETGELEREVQDFYQRKVAHRAGAESGRAFMGVGLMIAGADLLVASASGAETRLGMSQSFIGLSVVAIGTSAPLIAASIQAARRGDHDLVVGSVLGQSLFLALVGGALVGLVSHTPSVALNPTALWFMMGAFVTAGMFMARQRRVTRAEAGVLLLAYILLLAIVR